MPRPMTKNIGTSVSNMPINLVALQNEAWSNLSNEDIVAFTYVGAVLDNIEVSEFVLTFNIIWLTLIRSAHISGILIVLWRISKCLKAFGNHACFLCARVTNPRMRCGGYVRVDCSTSYTYCSLFYTNPQLRTIMDLIDWETVNYICKTDT